MLLAQVKARILERGMYGIRGLARTFWIMDNNGNGTLSADEFKDSLLEYGISLTKDQADEILRKFDKNKDGLVNFNEFLWFLRGDINPFWQGLILQAYKKLDANRDGRVRLDDIAKIYDASKHPDVLSGKASPEDVYMEFMSMWDTQEIDGIISPLEFTEYFKDVSASIDSDQYFEAMIKRAWGI
jgi:calcyphosin